jgi:hypothetical protein
MTGIDMGKLYVICREKENSGDSSCGSMFDVLCRNLSVVAKRQEEMSQPQGGWYGTVGQLCPERTTERFMVSTVLSGRGGMVGFPATAWLANFHRRFATKRWFLQSMGRAFRRRDLRGCPNRERTGGMPVPL